MQLNVARRMWTRFEAIHDVTYFTPEALAAYEAAGLRGYWRGYFAGRAAPLGPVDWPVVAATFYGFAPAMVRRAIPDVWSRATPEASLQARRDGATAAMERMLAEADVDLSGTGEAADLAEAAADLLSPAGHPLGAANQAIPRQDGRSALTRIWEVTATLREHRGDGHVAALVAYGFSGVESAVWGCEPQDRARFQPYRGWTDDEWDGAIGSLRDRGWLDAEGKRTDAGLQVYQQVEDATDREAMRVWEAFGAERTQRLADLLTPLAVPLHAATASLNPLHLPDPRTA